jgi:hypothetical protein
MLISLDPGRITGIAILSMNNFSAFEQSWVDAIRYVEQRMDGTVDKGFLVCEGYEVHQKNKMQYEALYSIGAVRYLCDKYSFEYIQQKPGDRLTVTKEMLEKLGYYRPSPDKHMIDATKHMVLFMLRRKWIDMKDLI